MPASGCGTDAACLCENQPYKTAVQNCLQANCPVRESLVAGRYQSEACGATKRSQVGLTRRVVWTLYTTAAISVLGRFIFRNPYLRGSGYGADDWTMLLAFILLTPQNAVIHAMTMAGLGLDIWTLEPDNITTLLHDFWVEAILYTFVMSTIKVSILLLYLRIWTSGTSWTAGFRRMCFVLIAINVAFGVALGLTVIFECSPVSYAWTRWDGEHTGKCIDYSAQSYAISGLNTLLDIVTFLLPIPKLLQLPISLRKKVGVCLIFALGLLATTASVVRLIYLIEYSTSPNFSWWFAPIAIWTSLECNLAVTTACLPSMAGLFQKVWNHTCKGTKWTYGSSGTNIDNVRLSELQTPSQYFEEGGTPRNDSIAIEGAKTSLRPQIIAKPNDATPHRLPQ
ncbi:putative extracellular membrane protein, CFEM [Septoria linicola]|nr:putative extracellular membrane protein, CFEM [Septoria linicola]